MTRAKGLDAPELYINRELSWLEFNQRVLDEGLVPELPLLERLKFLAIVGSNLDEFFQIRVAGLMQQRAADVRKRDPSGLTPGQQLSLVSKRVHAMVAQQQDAIRTVTAALARAGVRLLRFDQLNPEQLRFAHDYVTGEVLPILTPLAVEELDPCPLLPSLRLHIAALLATGTEAREPVLSHGEGSGAVTPTRLIVVPVPSQLPRFVTLPTTEELHLAPIEELIVAHLGSLIPNARVLATCVFRITRDADVAVQDDEAADLLSAVERAVIDRRRRAAVRLEISTAAHPRIRKWIVDLLQLRAEELYDIDGLLDSATLMEIVGREGLSQLKVPDWTPQPPRDLEGSEDLWATIAGRDLLLVHPYEAFDAVLEMLELAATDPQVLAVKQVLYRTSGDSPIVRALERAAQKGKQVTVLVELKARFDEARNVNWARRLEDAGCNVIYGIADFKTHAKALLVVRREAARIRRYVHLATGNYNDRTARLYSDIGLFTASPEVAADVAAFFNLLTGYSEPIEWARLTVAPLGLRQRFLDLIEREIAASTPDRPGLVIAKMNSLSDRAICRALYRASQAGVKVMLNVRGICCLRPGVPGISDNIEVRSIVDRYLEHARIYYFRNGGHEEVYLSSADWMPRNLDRRLELLFPVLDPEQARRIVDILGVYFADNVSARLLKSDGRYERAKTDGPPLRAQEKLYFEALQRAREAARSLTRFRPLTAPTEA